MTPITDRRKCPIRPPGFPAHSLPGAPPAPVPRQVPWSVPRELSPALPPGLGVSARSFTAVLRRDSGLTHRAQPRPFRLSLSTLPLSPLVLATLLEPSLPSPLLRTPFSVFQHLLCPLRFFQGLQPQPDAKRAGPACPTQDCDPGTTPRPCVCRGGGRWSNRSRSCSPADRGPLSAVWSLRRGEESTLAGHSTLFLRLCPAPGSGMLDPGGGLLSPGRGAGARAVKDSPLPSQRCWESRLCSPPCPHESEVLFNSLVDISGSRGVRLPGGWQRRRGRLRHGHRSPRVHPEPLHASVVQEHKKQPRNQPGEASVRARPGP